ncbi:alpha-galactosidase [Paenibacillus catalpae]|uniref:Alpha-galactosidase n=1 Tax=Paenibacillus catalpae TaxID=1045775 RepID=A0A1I1VPN5_9BACL|nr:alpha-galactosidase [Paenibacillus catalpae]SFD84795.1 alpha-galactosidase [Paenibacillus catalpae]
MTIQFDSNLQLFSISTKSSSYVFGLNDKGILQHLYWGAPVHAADCAPLMGSRSHSSFDAALDREAEEYAFWGGLSYMEPTLKVRLHDGVRDLRLRYDGYRIENAGNKETLTIMLKDETYPIEARLTYAVVAGMDLIERSVVIVNTGSHDVVLESAQSAAWTMPLLEDYRLTHVTGKWAGEFQLRETALSEGKKVLESRRGFTDGHANPWFAIDNGRATEESGEVWFGALAWSGNWKIVAEKTAFDLVRVTGGINDFDSEWTLAPGESFETPTFVGGYVSGGFGSMSRLLHRNQYEALAPGRALRKVLYNSWEATYFDVNVQDQTALAERAAKLGVELFVIDDGWFGQRNHDRAGLGDWTVNPEKFPSGLGELIDKVRGLGMEFGIWVEPEAVNPDSELYRQHPDWVYHFPTRSRTELRNQLVLNISMPEVKSYIIGFMTDLLERHDISFVKWDMNRTITEPGMSNHPLNRQKELWVRHVRSLYEIWSELRERFPHVAFETCAGGGSRIDFGMLRYADQAWPSDNTDAFDRLSIQEGFSYVYAPKFMTCWVTEEISGMNKRVTSIPYRFHSAMTGTLGIGANLNHWSEEQLTEAAALVAQYKTVRPLVQEGRQYRLSMLKHKGVEAVQYVGAGGSGEEESVLLAFLHSQKFGDRLPRLLLQGLNPDKNYTIDGIEGAHSGRALMRIGIELPLRGDFDSLMYHIREQK